MKQPSTSKPHLATLKDRMDYEAMQRAVDLFSSQCIATSGCGLLEFACCILQSALLYWNAARVISPSEASMELRIYPWTWCHGPGIQRGKTGVAAILEIVKTKDDCDKRDRRKLASRWRWNRYLSFHVWPENRRENAQGTTSFVVPSAFSRLTDSTFSKERDF
jgi:hypothetical protein